MPRLLQALVLGPLLSRPSNKHMRIVALKPNKDLARMNELFEAGRLLPVIDRSGRASTPKCLKRSGSLARAITRARCGHHHGLSVERMSWKAR